MLDSRCRLHALVAEGQLNVAQVAARGGKQRSQHVNTLAHVGYVRWEEREIKQAENVPDAK